MNVVSENDVTKDDIAALINCTKKKVRFMLIFLFAVFGVFLIFCLISKNTAGNVVYLTAGLIWCAAVYLFVFLINPALVYRSLKKTSGGTSVSFRLNEKAVTAKTASESKRKKYSDMFRIYETREYFFFYFKRNEAYIMKKDGITTGTSEEIRDAVRAQAAHKFISVI